MVSSLRRIPQETELDSTLALLRDPYGFISERCRRHGSDLFVTRLMLRPTICMTGPELAQLFYDGDKFERRGATPLRIQKTLFGRGGVQGLDGEAHRKRKQMFMRLMTPPRVAELGTRSRHWWDVYARKWQALDRVSLYADSCELLTRVACEWSGVPLNESEVPTRTHQLTALFELAGSIGPRHWQARRARGAAEQWAEGLVAGVRAGRLEATNESALSVIALFRDADGAPLEPRIAAVELLNVLRPTVAIAVFVAFAAHALHQNPSWRERLAAGEDPEAFVQEVRRFYPFFPAVSARVRRDFEWNGYRFGAGTRTMLDLYGTDHDPRSWDAPNEFRPERFASWGGNAFSFIPQGGGDHHLQHRCPGEWLTIEVMKVAARFLARGITYDVPEQDLGIDRSQLPALPRSRFIISKVRPNQSG